MVGNSAEQAILNETLQNRCIVVFHHVCKATILPRVSDLDLVLSSRLISGWSKTVVHVRAEGLQLSMQSRQVCADSSRGPPSISPAQSILTRCSSCTAVRRSRVRNCSLELGRLGRCALSERQIRFDETLEVVHLLRVRSMIQAPG